VKTEAGIFSGEGKISLPHNEIMLLLILAKVFASSFCERYWVNGMKLCSRVAWGEECFGAPRNFSRICGGFGFLPIPSPPLISSRFLFNLQKTLIQFTLNSNYHENNVQKSLSISSKC
jgi:hypothetical protein